MSADLHHCYHCGDYTVCEEVTVQGHPPDYSEWWCDECLPNPLDTSAIEQAEKEAEL